ncbi:ParB/RepB/Spo0J family partition protein [Candidatus Saccharibacteria bacterium]|nr:ParB/RepB/Spo0J family partition protein [Candidatus Saccharibacteria bacterium]
MAAKPKSGLGRGFDSLIPQNFDDSILLDEGERVHKIAIEKLVANSDQPRQHFDEEALVELASSIKRHGILQPLVVTEIGEGKYRIVAGERRWRAATKAKLTSVPVIVRTLKEHEELELALVENVQRVDLSPLEQAASIDRLRSQFNLTLADIAQRLGKAVSSVSNTERLLKLPDAAKKALFEEKISEGHARMILSLAGQAEHQAVLLDSILKQGWSVRQAERYVLGVKSGAQEVKAVKERVSTETAETKMLTKRFATPVHIRRTAKGGKLEIAFKSDDDLARIIELLSD